MSEPFQSLQSDNWVHISLKPGEKPLLDARGEGVNELRRLVDGVLGNGALDYYVGQYSASIVDSGVQKLQDGGVAATPLDSPMDRAPDFVPRQSTFGQSSSGTTFGGGGQKSASSITLGQKDGHDVVLWPTGTYGPSVVLKDFKVNGKDLRANLDKGEDPASVSLERAVQLLTIRYQKIQNG